jgi:hypothetical protein
MSESAIAIREQSGAAVVKAVPIPTVLQDLGVRIAEDEGGLRVIVLPPNVREQVNLLTPVSSWNQADPNWSPSVSLVQLDKNSHTYPLPGGKLGLNKQALETLGRCAGVLYTRTARVPRDELQENEMWAYRATVGFRRSDGTVDEVTRERGFNREAEELDIEQAVRGSERWKNQPREAQDAEIKKRWITELRFGPAKTESKAINRALRAGLAMPTSVGAGDLQKPFLVVGFNFTPDYNDPDVKRALIAVGMHAEQAIYGGRERSDEQPERGEADIPMPAPELEAAPADVAPADAPEAEGPTTPTAADQAAVSAEGAAEQGDGDGQRPAVAVASSVEPSLEDDDEEDGIDHQVPTEEPRQRGGLRVPEAAIEAAGLVAAKGETTVAQVIDAALGGHAKSVEWLSWAKLNLPPDEERLQALALYAQARAAELWANLPEA